MFLKQRAPLTGRRANLIAMAITALLYVVTAQLGLLLAMQDCMVTALWPPAGIALAAMMLFGRGLWPGVWIGAFIANLWPLLTKSSPVGIGEGILAAGMIAISATGTAWFSAWVISTLASTKSRREGVRGVAYFMLFGGVLSCFVGAAVSSTIFCATNPEAWPQWKKIWMTWWLGDALGVFLFTPLFLAWSERIGAWQKKIVIETIACFACLSMLLSFVFDLKLEFFKDGGPDDYIILPVIVWAGMRLGYRGVTTAIVFVALYAMMQTMGGSGPFVRDGVNDSLLFLGLYLSCLVVTGLCVAAVVGERTAAELALSESNSNLEVLVKDRTEELRQLTGRLYTTISDQAETLHALTESQARLNIASSVSKIGYWEWNIQTGTMEISPQWLAQIGYSHEESIKLLSNKVWRERLHPDDVERAIDSVKQYVRSPEKDYSIEFRLRHKDGSYRNIYSRGKCLLNGSGNPERMIGYHVDVTELRAAEQSAVLFKTLLDKSNDCIEVIDPETGRFLDSNARWCEEHGYTREEMLRLTVMDVDPHLEERQLHENVERLKKIGGLIYESVHRRKDGSELAVEVSINYVRTDRPYLLVVVRNITERKRVEEQLKNNEQRLRLALGVANMGSWDWNLITNDTRSDLKLRLLFSGEINATPEKEADFFRFIHSEDAPQVREAIRAAVEGDGNYSAIFRVVWKDSSIHWLEGRGSVFRDATGKPVRMIGVTADITERRRNERRIETFATLAFELNKAVTHKEAARMVTDVADELIGWDATAIMGFYEKSGLCRALWYVDTIDGVKQEVESELDNRKPTLQMLKTIQHGKELILRKADEEDAGILVGFGNKGRRSKSLMFVPIRDGTTTVGMLSIQSYRVNAYTQSDLDTLQSLADECAAALARIASHEGQREAQERLAIAASAANIGNWDWDLIHNRAEYSDAWHAHLGYSRGDVGESSEAWKNLIHPDDREMVVKMADEYIRGFRNEFRAEMRMRHKNGSYRWILSQGKILKSADGRARRLVGCHVDITEAKESELRDAQNLSLLQATIESSAHGLLVVDTDNRVTLFNQRFASMWKIPRELLETNDDKALLAFVLEQLESPETFIAGVEALYSTPEAESFDTLNFKDGRVFERYSRPQRIGERIVGRVWDFRDVTEKRAAEESLQRLGEIVESSGDAIVGKTLTGIVTSWNKGAEKVFGYTAAEMVGQSILKIYPEELMHTKSDIFSRIADGRGVENLETTRLHKSGRVIHVSLTISPVRDKSGRIVGASEVARDVTERIELERKRHLSEERLRACIETTPNVSVQWYDEQGRVVFWNQASERVFGWTSEEALGRTPGQLFHDLAGEEEFFKVIHDIKSTGDSVGPVEFPFHRKDQSRGICISTMFSIPSPEGGLYFVCMDVDITERKEVEAALRESREQFADLVNNIDGIVWEAEVDSMQMTFVSDQAQRILGYPLNDWLSSKTFWADHIHPDDREFATTYCTAQTGQGKSHDFEYRMIAADGRVVWLRDLVVITAKPGKPANLRGIMVDITKRKVAEHALQESEAHFKALFENAPDAVFLIGLEADERGKIFSANRAAAQMHGYSVEELTSMTILQLDAPGDIEESKERIERLLKGERMTFEISHVRKDGTTFLVEVTAELLIVRGRRFILAFDRDITERKANELLLANQKRVLELIASGTGINETLAELCLAIEEQCAGARCTIMVVDEDRQHLRSFAGPHMPPEYNALVDRLPIGMNYGSCGTAAYLGEPVIVEDVRNDVLWEKFKEVGDRFGFRSCWSTPILDQAREVIGTFAVYRDIVCKPSEHDIRVVSSAKDTAAIAIEKQMADNQLARSREVLRRLSADLVEAQEAERRHLARELHDEVGQTLTATKILLQSIKQDGARPSAHAATREPAASSDTTMISSAVQNVDQMLQIVRNLSLNLRPPMLDDFGLVSALRWLLDRHTMTTGRTATLDADYAVEQPDPKIETACFRITQEALTNITRHSAAKKVLVTLKADAGGISLKVTDDGVGFDVQAAQQTARHGSSLGLLNLHERASLVGGKVHMISAPGQGTQINATFPLASPNVSATT